MIEVPFTAEEVSKLRSLLLRQNNKEKIRHLRSYQTVICRVDSGLLRLAEVYGKRKRLKLSEMVSEGLELYLSDIIPTEIESLMLVELGDDTRGIRESARQALSYAVKNDEVVPQRECSKCGSENNVQGHHDDYSKPLDVQWLCSVCHGLTRRRTDV